eukprot:3044371-Amphidinium_carterae.1
MAAVWCKMILHEKALPLVHADRREHEKFPRLFGIQHRPGFTSPQKTTKGQLVVQAANGRKCSLAEVPVQYAQKSIHI